MNGPLAAIAQRRALLAGEVAGQRAAMRATLADFRKELAFAGLGLIAGRALVRRPLLRAVVLGGLAAFAARSFSAQRPR